MKIESRYVEYMGFRRVHEGKWVRHMEKVPEGCLDVGLDEPVAFKRVKRFEEKERKEGCSNFEYRVI